MELNAQVWTVISTLAGTFIGSLFTYLATRTAARSEERRQYKEVVIKAALENWKEGREHAKEWAKSTHQPVLYAPLDLYLIHAAKLIELTVNKKFRASDVASILGEVHEVSRAAMESAKQYGAKGSQQSKTPDSK